MKKPPNLNHQEIENKFRASYATDNNNDCWKWVALKNAGGYGVFSYNAKQVLAHRFSYEKANGEQSLIKGMCICHKCHNRDCVNPQHLYQGSYKDNTSDFINSGRKQAFKKYMTSAEFNKIYQEFCIAENECAKYLKIKKTELRKYSSGLEPIPMEVAMKMQLLAKNKKTDFVEFYETLTRIGLSPKIFADEKKSYICLSGVQVFSFSLSGDKVTFMKSKFQGQ